jgi:hypothetical protein
MWLPKDERRLIEGYYINIGEIEKKEWFCTSNWIPVILTLRVKVQAKKIKSYFKGGTSQSEHDKIDPKDPDGSIKNWIKYKSRVNIAITALEARRLIKTHPHQSEPDVKAVSLTIDGYDLGRKYSSCWTRSGLWFKEYKDHWIWIIISFLGGIIGGLFINWLSKGD